MESDDDDSEDDMAMLKGAMGEDSGSDDESDDEELDLKDILASNKQKKPDGLKTSQPPAKAVKGNDGKAKPVQSKNQQSQPASGEGKKKRKRNKKNKNKN